MPRKARDERLDTRTARLRLTVRREPYWRSIQEGRAIGYRRLPGGKSGSWIARRYDAATGRQYKSIGSADDYLDADGVSALTFAQAQERAAEWFRKTGQRENGAVEPITVREAVAYYLADYRARGGRAPGYVETTFNAHVLPQLGDKRAADLTPKMIREWHHALASAPARLRTAARAAIRGVREVASDDDARRARRATANAVFTLLKAALNLAFREGRLTDDTAWRRVRPFQKVGAARVRYLMDDEAMRLVNACAPELRALVTAALLTGCRYAELTALRPADINLTARVLNVRASKSGQPRAVVLTDEAAGFFSAAMSGKAPIAVLLPRADGEAWGKSHQFRPLREACRVAGITPAISFHILRHTHASRLAMKGVPMGVIAAQLGHSDIKLTARHYAHLSPGYVADTIRAAFGSLGIVPETNVTRLADCQT